MKDGETRRYALHRAADSGARLLSLSQQATYGPMPLLNPLKNAINRKLYLPELM